MMRAEISKALVEAALHAGAHRASVIEAHAIPRDAVFREICASNACGMYGRCYMCPPDLGAIHDLMARIDEYDLALVYQTVDDLLDSFDFEGMVEAKQHVFPITRAVCDALAAVGIERPLRLGVGGCGVCEICAKRTGEPCRHPDLAMPSLEAYGVNVSGLAALADMKYTNGQNTVTYFGAILFRVDKSLE